MREPNGRTLFTVTHSLMTVFATNHERSMMSKFDGNALRSLAFACMFAGAAGGMGLPQAALAQPAAAVRGLPDFTDLVDQVGPSVVNIRTVEKASSRASANGMDEEMMEFFRRFGVPIPNVPRQQRPQRPQDDEQPRGVGGEIQLTDGIAALLNHEKILSYRFAGKRYDCGSKLGFMQANVELALKHHEIGNDFKAYLKTLAV